VGVLVTRYGRKILEGYAFSFVGGTQTRRRNTDHNLLMSAVHMTGRGAVQISLALTV
jgi:hypothetical protein